MNKTRFAWTANGQRGAIVWQLHYDGLVTVAYHGGQAVAGISGPWSDRYALTWWAQPMQAGQLELFESMEAAKHEVVSRIQPTDAGLAKTLFSVLKRGPSLRLKPSRLSTSWLARFGSLFSRESKKHLQNSRRNSFELLRQERMRKDTDLRGVHFHAFE